MSETYSFVNVESNVMQSLIKRLEPKETLVLEHALQLGAYVAGGSARLLYHGHIKFDDERYFRVDREIYHDLRSNRVDLDLFFPTREAADALLAFARKENCSVELSVSGAAYDINAEPKQWKWGKSTFQAITLDKAIGNIHDVLSQFDILPAMVALNYDGFIVPQESFELDKQKIMHVKDIKTPFTLLRIAKYLTKYGYETIDDTSSEKIVDCTYKYIGDSRRGEPFTYAQTNYKFEEFRAINNCKQLVSALNIPALMKAAFLFSKQAYNYAFQEVVRRSKKNLSK